MSRAFNRREFLRTCGQAVPLVARPFSANAPQVRVPGTSGSVVVVGAGLAGLRAAAILRKAGRDVVVLEARGFPGGRVQTIRAPFDEDLYAEAGAIRIPAVHETVLQLAKEHGLDLVPFESFIGSAVITVRGVTSRIPEGLEAAESALGLNPDEKGLGQGGLLQRYVGDLPRELGDPAAPMAAYAKWLTYDSVTWPEWLRTRGASAGAVALMTLGGDSRGLSALYVLRQFALLRNTSQFYKIHGGMDQLPRAMAKALGAVVRYNAPVVRLEQSGGAVRVGYMSGGVMKTITADHVIVAIPFSTLRLMTIRPAWSAPKTRAIAQLPYFPATRFLLQCRSSFWQADGLSGSARTDQPAEMWDCTYDLAGTRGILGATAGGDIGASVATMTQADAVKLGTSLVSQAFPLMRSSFEKGSAYRWVRDPWSRGAFAVFHPGQMTTMMPGIGEPEGRIHFAGEHTSAWMGWMEGALESGARAAREVIEASGRMGAGR